MQNLKSYAPYFLACLGVFLFGGLFQPGEWYTQINRAPWTPPNWVFPIAWTLLYIFISITGYLIAKAQQPTLLKIWWLQLFFNAIWSWLFFSQHWIGVALIDLLIVLDLVAYLTYACFTRGLNIAGWLLTPYLAWLTYAASLNTYIWLYN